MLLGIAPDSVQSEVVRVLTVEFRDSREHVVTVIICSRQRRLRVSYNEQLVFARRLRHSFVWIHLNRSGVRDYRELQPVYVQRLFQLVCDSELVAAVTGFELIRGHPHVLVRVRVISLSRSLPITHLTATHEVRYELESRSIPRVKIRTGGWLAIQL